MVIRPRRHGRDGALSKHKYISLKFRLLRRVDRVGTEEEVEVAAERGLVDVLGEEAAVAAATGG